MLINQVFIYGKKEKNEKRTRKEREYIYILKDVKRSRKKGRNILLYKILTVYL